MVIFWGKTITIASYLQPGQLLRWVPLVTFVADDGGDWLGLFETWRTEVQCYRRRVLSIPDEKRVVTVESSYTFFPESESNAPVCRRRRCLTFFTPECKESLGTGDATSKA